MKTLEIALLVVQIVFDIWVIVYILKSWNKKKSKTKRKNCK